MEQTVTAILPRLGSGLFVLLLHLLTTLALLALGALCYMGVTPFRERILIATGNTAAGLVLAGTLIALAIPLAAMLATSHVWLDIVVWGLVAVILQLHLRTGGGGVSQPAGHDRGRQCGGGRSARWRADCYRPAERRRHGWLSAVAACPGQPQEGAMFTFVRTS